MEVTKQKWNKYSFKDLRATAQELFKDFAASPKSYYFWGTNGTGKTLTLNVLIQERMNHIIKNRVRNCNCYITNTDEITDAYIKRNESDNFKELMEYSVLGIDDVGDTYLNTPNSREYTLAALNRLIRSRGDDEKVTLITSEAPLTASTNKKYSLKQSIGQRLASYLTEYCIQVEFTGSDKRMEKEREINV